MAQLKDLLVSGASRFIGASMFNNDVHAAGQFYIDNTTDASSYSTGALIIAGGVGIAKKLYVNGATNIAGITTISNNTASSTTANGALVVTGGIGVGGKVTIGSSGFSSGGSGSIIGSLTVNPATASDTALTVGASGKASGVKVYGKIVVDGTGSFGDTTVTKLTATTGTTSTTNALLYAKYGILDIENYTSHTYLGHYDTTNGSQWRSSNNKHLITGSGNSNKTTLTVKGHILPSQTTANASSTDYSYSSTANASGGEDIGSTSMQWRSGHFYSLEVATMPVGTQDSPNLVVNKRYLDSRFEALIGTTQLTTLQALAEAFQASDQDLNQALIASMGTLMPFLNNTTDEAIVRFSDTSGHIQNSIPTINDDGRINAPYMSLGTNATSNQTVLVLTGNSSLSGTLSVNGISTFNNNVILESGAQSNGNIIPDTSRNKTLGNSTNIWGTLYTDAIQIGNFTLSTHTVDGYENLAFIWTALS